MSTSVKLIREQKEEYMDHLFDLIYEFVYTKFKELYQETLDLKESQQKGVLKTFQKEIAKIPEWNQLKVEQIYKDLLEKNKCTYFPDLLKTIYVLTIKLVLLGLPKENRNKIKIKIPNSDAFLHRLMIHIARDVWKRPYLFYHQVKSIEHQNNLYQFELIVRKKIRSVIRETIPMDLMVQYMSTTDIINNEESETSSEDETATESSEDEISSDDTPVESSEDETSSDDTPVESEDDDTPVESEDDETSSDDTSVQSSDSESKLQDDTQVDNVEKEESTAVSEESSIHIVKEEVPTITEEKPVIESSGTIMNIPVTPIIINEEHETIYEEPKEELSSKKMIHIERKHRKKSKNAFF